MQITVIDLGVQNITRLQQIQIKLEEKDTGNATTMLFVPLNN